jgi:hypothetical protein
MIQIYGFEQRRMLIGPRILYIPLGLLWRRLLWIFNPNKYPRN